MYKKFCILLFVTIFCNGVTYSSPTKANSRDLISKEQEASVEVISHINHQVGPNTSAPNIGVSLNETATVKTSSNHSVADDKSIPRNSTAVEKSENQVSDFKNDEKNLTATITKSPKASFNDSTTTTFVPTASTPAAVPVTRSNTSDLPPTNFSEMSRPIIAGRSTTTVSTLATGTTTKAPMTMPTTVTSKPMVAVSTTTDSVHLEHNSSKAQENRFDGASFVGGIVLTVGLTAIGFIAFKYYKSGKIDGNYRSL